MEYAGFVGGSYQSLSPIADNELTFNLYPENIESPGAPVRSALYPTPGVQTLSTSTNTPGRAHFVQGTREFAVMGNQFGEINAAGTFSSLGTVALGTTPATLSSNGDAGSQIMITSGGNVYIYNFSSGSFAFVSSLNGKGDIGASLGGYFLIMDTDTGTWYFSALNDGLTWNTGTNFVQRGLAPDPWISMKVVNRYIWLFGRETTEIWYDAGEFPRPFKPYATNLIPFGIAAAFSPVVANNVLVWLGQSKDGRSMALKSEGFSAQIISTYALSNLLSGYSDISDAIGDTYTSKGHTFYVLNMTKANSTIAWDANTQLWHNRGTWSPDDNEFLVWRPRHHAHAYGQNRMLDSETGAVYQISDEFTTDVDDMAIRRMRRPPPLYNENNRIFINSFELNLEPGLGTTTGQGEDPQVMLRISNDGGKTYGIEHWASAGKIGEYNARAMWHRCGQGRRRVFEVSMTDPIPWRVLGAHVSVRQ